jgi:hypothetical protein
MNTQLSDARIAAMRRHVLSTVDADVKQRGQRTRKAIAGGIGALALITVLGISLPTLTGGASGPDAVTSQSADGGTSAAMPEPAEAGDGLAGDAAADGANRLDARAGGDYAAKEAAPDGDISPVPPLTAPGKDREIVMTGSIQLNVRDANKEAAEFTRWVEQHGGRIDARHEYGDDVVSTSLTARIPSKHVGAAVAQLRTQGDVMTADLGREDVTAQGADLDGRIKALKISIERLENILNRAGSSSEVIEAETALSQRQQELQSLELQRRSLDDQVALSTLVADFVQYDSPGAVTPGGFRGGVITGWNALIDTVNAIVTAAGAAVPWLGIGLVVGLLWWGIRRARRS